MAAELERHNNGVATITLNRPEALNAFNTYELESLIAVLGEVRQDSTIRAVILTGAGDRAFAAGADIKEMASFDLESGRAFGQLGHAATNGIEHLPQPVIAAVNGFALGGGCEVALAADFRLASENAMFAQPEVSLGIPPGWGGSQRLPRLIGPGLAAELILTGRRVKADEAFRIGLVNQVLPLAELLPAAMLLAEKIAANSPQAVRAAKRLMQRAFAGSLERGFDAELEAFGQAFAGPDQKEGMQAFVEKRTANFTDPHSLIPKD